MTPEAVCSTRRQYLLFPDQAYVWIRLGTATKSVKHTKQNPTKHVSLFHVSDSRVRRVVIFVK